jgi:hypothetical protein
MTLALGPGAPAAAARQSKSVPSITVKLAPVASAGKPGAIGKVSVELRFAGVGARAGAPLLRIPLVVSNVDTVATQLSELRASDAAGPLKLAARGVDLPVAAMRDAEGGGPSREWIAERTVRGPVVVRYEVPAEAVLPPRGPAPPFSFSADGGGVSAAGNIFILLPPGDAKYRTTFDWDLARAPAGSRGISSLGEGRRTASGLLTGAQIRESFFMGGRIGTWPPRIPGTGFFGAWQGSPCFNPRQLLEWTGRLYGDYARFFGQKTAPPYGVFLRYNPVNAGGGVGLYHSFLTTFGAGTCAKLDQLRITLAHEMFHTFQPYIEVPAGLESSWFGEGLATFYQARLPFRFGMISADQYLADVNWTAARYYTSIMARVPNSEVPKRFWSDTRIRTLPYDRGMLYFATVDDALRSRSGGRQSLDDLVLRMLALHRRGRTLTNADWESALRTSLGEGAVEDFRAFLQGRMPVPSSAAFGRCFERVSRPLRRYELGFEPAVLAEPKRIVRGLVAGSNAERAGLRNGDEIVLPVPQDAIQGDQQQRILLQVRRNGATFAVQYLPRGETVNAWQWVRRPGTERLSCAS